jgi:hypothetical protein
MYSQECRDEDFRVKILELYRVQQLPLVYLAHFLSYQSEGITAPTRASAFGKPL